MRVVVALGGNALLKAGEPMTARNQRANIKRAVTALAGLVEGGHSLVITHGNGPQVGLLALQAAAVPSLSPFPLDVLDAESEGMIGYVLEQELGNAMSGRDFATLLTQVLVDARDPAFASPTKPVGPFYDETVARRLADERGWVIAPCNDKWRRLVPSPKPLAVLEVKVFSLLIRHAITIVCAGGGGIPVVHMADGRMTGVEAVVDKDLTSALLARQVDADLLLMLTDVDAVYLDWQKPSARALHRVRPSELCGAEFAAGSMRPKIEAAVEFVNATRKPAAIGKLEDAVEIVGGTRGTRIEQ